MQALTTNQIMEILYVHITFPPKIKATVYFFKLRQSSVLRRTLYYDVIYKTNRAEYDVINEGCK